MRQIGDKVREVRVRWFGYVQRRDEEEIGRRRMEKSPTGRRKRGRLERRFVDASKEEMLVVDVTGEDAEDRVSWRRMIRCGDAKIVSGNTQTRKFMFYHCWLCYLDNVFIHLSYCFLVINIILH